MNRIEMHRIVSYSILCSVGHSQWRSQDITVARAQHGHTTFVRTSARSAEAYSGSGGILLPKFYSLPGRF